MNLNKEKFPKFIVTSHLPIDLELYHYNIWRQVVPHKENVLKFLTDVSP